MPKCTLWKLSSKIFTKCPINWGVWYMCVLKFTINVRIIWDLVLENPWKFISVDLSESVKISMLTHTIPLASLLRLSRSFCGCPQCGAVPYRDCFLDLRLFNSPDLRRLGLCYCCQAWTLETVLGGNTALTRWWTARTIDADAKR